MGPTPPHAGTLFRFPLRGAAAAAASDIKPGVACSPAQVLGLLASFRWARHKFEVQMCSSCAIVNCSLAQHNCEGQVLGLLQWAHAQLCTVAYAMHIYPTLCGSSSLHYYPSLLSTGSSCPGEAHFVIHVSQCIFFVHCLCTLAWCWVLGAVWRASLPSDSPLLHPQGAAARGAALPEERAACGRVCARCCKRGASGVLLSRWHGLV